MATSTYLTFLMYKASDAAEAYTNEEPSVSISVRSAALSTS